MLVAHVHKKTLVMEQRAMEGTDWAKRKTTYFLQEKYGRTLATQISLRHFSFLLPQGGQEALYPGAPHQLRAGSGFCEVR